MSNSLSVMNKTIAAAFAASHAASPSVVIGAAIKLGPDGVKAAAVNAAPAVGRTAKAATDWARQMSTAAALHVLVYDETSTDDIDRVAQACITRAKASADTVKANGCKATGSGNTLIGKVSRMVEEKNQKAALADIRKASTKAANRGPKDGQAVAALVKSCQSKVKAFEKAAKDGSPTVQVKAREILDALDILRAAADKADKALVKVAVAGEDYDVDVEELAS